MHPVHMYGQVGLLHWPNNGCSCVTYVARVGVSFGPFTLSFIYHIGLLSLLFNSYMKPC